MSLGCINGLATNNAGACNGQQRAELAEYGWASFRYFKSLFFHFFQKPTLVKRIQATFTFSLFRLILGGGGV